MAKRTIHLRIKPRTGDHQELGAFLRNAVPYYEALPGVRVRLLRSLDDPSQYVEVVEYETVAAFNADEKRMAIDPRMQAFLRDWRATLAQDVIVETYEDVSEEM
ncbi:MAG: antibiotic biosynthesis monooxygenase [Hyphomonadaceae bacterium]|nr:antibiotic biosynthesis monooxygenase [Hyphomonadaceae bacterium]GIK49122.1 MAG: hypothetical protein BroJett013_18190 [Alphaproteobacteria bacterium]